MKLLFSLILSVILSGCFIFGDPTDLDETEGRSDQWIINEAEFFSSSKDWTKAISFLEAGEKRFPNSKLAPQFKLNLAYAYKEFYKTAEATSMINKFIRAHPNHPSMDYAYYFRGIITFKEKGFFKKIVMQDISDRDINQLTQSFNAFKKLTEKFPKSKYYDDSVHRMTYLMNKISEYELHVARFYMRRAAYVAALNRAKFVIENYSQSVHQEEALVLMVSCYDRLGIKDLRDDTERVLEKNYPNTKFNAQKIIENKAEWWEFWDSMIND
jgi:outer membrane protein assembly factor BamD